jgi:hypothetical protein
MAFRMLHEFLAEGENSSHQVTLAPHLVMRGNLNFFLKQQTRETVKEQVRQSKDEPQDLTADFA